MRERALALLGFLLLLSLGCQRPASPTPRPFSTPTPTPPGSLYTVKRGDIVETLKVRGRIVGGRETILSFPLGGWIKSLNLTAGDLVEEGQLLAELEVPELEETVEQARYRYLTSQLDYSTQKEILPVQNALQREKLLLQAQMAQAQKEKAEAWVEVRRLELDQKQGYYERVSSPYTPSEIEQFLFTFQEHEVNHLNALVNQASIQQQIKDTEALVKEQEAKVQATPNDIAARALLERSKAQLQNLYKAQQAADLTVVLRKGVYEWTKRDYGEKVASKTAGNVEQALINLKLAEAEYKSALLQVQLEELGKKATETEVKLAEAQARSDELRIELAEKEMNFRKQTLASAEKKLEQTRLIAPYAGYVLSVETKVGSGIEPFETIAAIADPSLLQAEAQVLEADLEKVALGQPVQVILDAYPQFTFAGKVEQVSSQSSIWQGKRAYRVTVAFDEVEKVPRAIRMGTDNYITTRKKLDVVVIPSSAIMASADRKLVEAWSGGKSLKMEIETGFSNGKETEVVSGLKEGQQIILP